MAEKEICAAVVVVVGGGGAVVGVAAIGATVVTGGALVVVSTATGAAVVDGAGSRCAGSPVVMAVPEVVVTVGPRSVEIFDDVVGTLFGASGLGAIRFHSDDLFSVTSRIFTDSNCGDPEGGTFGQFVTGAAEDAALVEGAILNLEVSEAFRSNLGVHNPSLESATVTLTLHGSSGVLAGPVERVFGPREPLGPTALVNLFGLASIDDENLWVEFSATRPVHVYGSVVDEITQDQIFVHAVAME